jgi:LytS/YehU family sensor histidine kinase
LEISRANATARLLTQAELRALHAQIHPHFLFNALNAISAVCRRDSERARELLVSLSQYLRSSIRASDSMVTLGEELEVVVAYLAIEKARFGDRLRSEINVPAELISLKVPILSIQPLVENSIRHGLMPRAHGGTVNIGASIDGESLLLMVTDDGVESSPHGADGGNGIALQNIRERLRHLYGSEGSLTLGSAPDGGTTALLRLPAQAENR